MKKLVYYFFLFLVFILMFFVPAEIFLRIKKHFSPESDSNPAGSIHQYFYYDSDGCARIRPGSKGKHISYRGEKPVFIKINSIGIRGPELRKHPKLRIVFLGDSVVFAGGVPFEYTLTAQIEKKMSQACPEKDIECLNFGVTDSGISQYYLKLKYHALEVKPDVVVIGFYLNDSRSPQGFLGEEGKVKWEQDLEKSPFYQWEIVKTYHQCFRKWRYTHHPELKDRFKWVRRYLGNKYLEDENDWNSLLEEAEFDWGAAWKKENWTTIENHLGKINQLCHDNQIRLFLVCFPVSLQISIQKPYLNLLDPQEKIRRICARFGIVYYDLIPALKRNQMKPIFIDQCHLTKIGCDVVSQALFEWLKDTL
ncbi:MAG: SGNH/GDSL hydrolase family protein [Candidatus Aureabacteria bacterium]|nr:SGNH/GDSL hydrolase family protein [Candidatus Auribacterota bacterium]